MRFKQRILIYAGIIALVIASSFFWGSPGQSINMRQARRETEKITQMLKEDIRFSNIKFGCSTALLGKLIVVKGSVSDQNNLDILKNLIQENISPKFEMMYIVEIEKENADAGDDPNSVKSEENSESVYIPRDLNECFAELIMILEPRAVGKIKKKAEDDMIEYHFGLGMLIRNKWGLWEGSRLSKWFNEKGIYHPDDMSGIILVSFWRYLNLKPIKLDEQIKFYQDYWNKIKENGDDEKPADF